MATITFYEKPGCINNTKQKKLLIQAGHSIIAKSLLTENWSASPAHLREFFADKPVSEWFNCSAPAIKNGDVIPKEVAADEAIILMLADPLLIRRPLMQINNEKKSGFDQLEVDQWIGLSNQVNLDLESCPYSDKLTCNHE